MIRTKDQLLAEVSAAVADNNVQANTPAKLRTLLANITDSLQAHADAASLTVETATILAGNSANIDDNEQGGVEPHDVRDVVLSIIAAFGDALQARGAATTGRDDLAADAIALFRNGKPKGAIKPSSVRALLSRLIAEPWEWISPLVPAEASQGVLRVTEFDQIATIPSGTAIFLNGSTDGFLTLRTADAPYTSHDWGKSPEEFARNYGERYWVESNGLRLAQSDVQYDCPTKVVIAITIPAGTDAELSIHSYV